MSSNDCRVYVGNFPSSIKTEEIEELFSRFGKICYVDLRQKSGPPFAFVEFDDPRDAKEVVLKCDGYYYKSCILRVEFCRVDRFRNDKRRGPRSRYRVAVSGLPPSGSWQDLKDHMRKVSREVGFADVYKDGSGIVEFRWYNDMKCAVRKLDGSKFRSHEDETSYIRVKEDYGREDDRDLGRSRSRSTSTLRRSGRRHSRSRSTSPPRRSGRRHSRSRSTSPPRRSGLRHSRSRSTSPPRRSGRRHSRSRSTSPPRRSGRRHSRSRSTSPPWRSGRRHSRSRSISPPQRSGPRRSPSYSPISKSSRSRSRSRSNDRR